MKPLLLICFTTLSLHPAFSQNVKLKLFVEDAIGRKDTVIFGVNDTSTLGIDTSLGEVNIYGTPFDSLDIRIIQRDSAHFNCIRTSHYTSVVTNLYFPENIESKIDFRPFGPFISVYNNFEIFINAINYPVVIRADFSDIQGSWLEGYSVIHLLDSNCDAVETKGIYSTQTNDTLFTLPDSSFNTLVANFQHEVGIAEINSLNNLVTISPNPLSENLHVKIANLTLDKAAMTVYNLFGQKFIGNQITQESFEINVADLTSGIYILEISNNNKTIRQKFIKK
jgi:hypothetical protein